MKKRARRAITLIEMIIVMILIAMITGAVAYNYRESLNEGRAFKTKELMSRLDTIIAIYLAENPEQAANIESSWQNIILRSSLLKNPKESLKDGWGQPFKLEQRRGDGGQIEYVVVSEEYERYRKKKGK